MKQVESADYNRPAIFTSLAIFESAHPKPVVVLELPPFACRAVPDTFIMQFQGNLGWIAVNILVPVALPFAVLACVSIANGGWRSFCTLIIKAVDGGQLFWAALGMMASNCYEAFGAYDKHPELRVDIGWAIGLNVTLILFTTIFIATSASRSARGQQARPIVILISVAMAAGMCLYYPHEHFKYR